MTAESGDGSGAPDRAGDPEGCIGSDFDRFLDEEGILADVEAVAVKRVLAFQLAEAMRQGRISKSALAKRMKTSRMAVDRLLDPDRPSVTLKTLDRAARALGRTLKVELT